MYPRESMLFQIPLLRESISRRQMKSMAQCYSSIPIQELASSCGMSSDDISAVCAERGWDIDVTQGY